MSPTANRTHDYTLEDKSAGTPKIGCMFPRDGQGHRPFVIKDYRTLAPRQLTMGEITQAEFPVEVELTWPQEDWRLGLGGRIHRLDPKRIAKGVKIDTTAEGAIKPARELLNPALGNAPTAYVPSGFALAAQGSTADLDIWCFVGRDYYNWNYTTKLWGNKITPYAADVLYRNGVQFKNYTVIPSWYSIDQSPTNYLYKENAISSTLTRVADLLTAGATSLTHCKYMVKGKNSAGADLLWGGNWVTVFDVTSAITEDLDTTETGVDVTDGTEFAENDVILIDSELMLVAGITTNTLVVTRGYHGTTAANHSSGATISRRRYDGKNYIRSTTDQTNQVNWSSAVSIGDSSSEITNLVQDGDTLLVCKTNGIWTYKVDGTQENLTPEYENRVHPDNFRVAFNWNGHVILALGLSGMVELVGGELVDVSMKLKAVDQTQLHGRVVAMTGNPTQLFILVQEIANVKYHLLMAEWVEFEGKQDYSWHHMGTVAYTTGTTEEFCTIWAEGQPSGANIHNRVWVGVHSSGSNLYPYFLPLDDDAEAVSTNDTDVECVTSTWDKNLPQVDARLDSVELKHTNCDSDDYWEIKYSVDAGTNWNYFGAGAAESRLVATGTRTSTTLTFPAEVTGKEVLLQFKVSIADTSKRIEINSFNLKAQLRTSAVKSIPAVAYLAANQMLLNGAIGGRPKLDLAQLEAWNAGAPEVKLIDPRSTSRDVVFVPGSLSVEEIANERWRSPEYLVKFLLLAV